MPKTAEERRAYQRKYMREWRKANPDRYAANAARSRKNRVEQMKDQVYKAYGDECACSGCTITNRIFFTLDHVDGDGAEHRRELSDGKRTRNNWQFLKWIIDNGFPDTIQILCANCHLAKTRGVPCPHLTSGV